MSFEISNKSLLKVEKREKAKKSERERKSNCRVKWTQTSFPFYGAQGTFAGTRRLAAASQPHRGGRGGMPSGGRKMGIFQCDAAATTASIRVPSSASNLSLMQSDACRLGEHKIRKKRKTTEKTCYFTDTAARGGTKTHKRKVAILVDESGRGGRAWAGVGRRFASIHPHANTPPTPESASKNDNDKGKKGKKKYATCRKLTARPTTHTLTQNDGGWWWR
ncbi:hypothetical protein BB8028_0007g05560 [Beauveria bassiana]|uniref:Uncharacterized protein n=1 Tax=Beauveria bassiana TaxID=176275 RepID=A0A2S7YMF0_BEABA|nr:hypothetical protein BB8028_0007g05560 [Beauveria bassiana]